MRLTFLGAAREVTGSCILLEAAGRKLLIDFGMEQGRDVYENAPLPVAPGEVDALFITHAHVDHTGRVPYLYKNGFRGPIYATDATMDLCAIMLEDSAHIQEQDAEYKNRKNRRGGRPLVEPEYTVADAQAALGLFKALPYGEWRTVFPGIEVRFTDVGHLLGSASVTLRVAEAGREQTIVFSGDIGNSHLPLLRDPAYLTEADYVVMESTYGDRTHGPRPDHVRELAAITQRTLDRGGNVVIPSFAVGRTQELLYFYRQIKAEGLVKGHDGFPVYVDSPLASRSTNIFRENYAECYDEEALALVQTGQNPLQFPGLRISETADDSKALNTDPTPKVIISASGMCDAGRIRHHLKYNLWRRESTVLFVGYQAGGSVGRQLVDGAAEVKLFGEPVAVRAEIAQLTGLSGHADRDGLQAWIDHFAPRPKFVFVNHGDDEVAAGWARRLNEQGYRAEAPYNGAVYALEGGGVRCLAQGNTKRIQKGDTPQQKRANQTYERLANMGRRLLAVIESNRDGANKDLAKFADQIASLCDKWDR